MSPQSKLLAAICGILFVGLAETFQLQPSGFSKLTNLTPRDRMVSTVKTAGSAVASLRVVTEERKASVEETTEKFGLEIGLAQAAKEKDGESAKSLLKKYGIAYLATSIPLAILSFALCYVLVDSGVDVSALLAKVGIENSGAADKAGTLAIAYAAHKAASPIRFPPTVLLTPIVAKMLGREPTQEAAE